MKSLLNRAFRPALELLEDRVTPSISVSNGLLLMRSTSNDDYIVVHYQQPDNPASNVQATILNSSGQVLETQTYASSSVSNITIYAKEGNDYIVNSTDVPSTIYAGSGNDWLKGGGANDRLVGDVDSDNFQFSPQRWAFRFVDHAFQGFLVMGTHTSLGLDTVEEAADRDSDSLRFNDYVFTSGAAYHGINLRLGSTAVQDINDELSIALTSSTGLEVFHGSSRDDYVVGNYRNNRLYGGGRDDLMNGLEGNDYLDGGDRDDVYWFGLDQQVDLGDLGRDTIVDAAGEDGITFQHMPDGITIDLASVDVQSVLPGRLEIVLDSAITIENAQGSEYADVLRGNRLANQLIGGDGNDSLEGRGGRDYLLGDHRDPRRPGSTDNDRYIFSGSFDLGLDVLSDHRGIDTLDFSDFAYGVNLDLALMNDVQTLSAGYLQISLFSDEEVFYFENVKGTSRADVIWGNDRRNEIYGFGGNDEIHGRGNNDELYGGAGRDQLFGDAGNDRLYGGSDHARDELTGGDDSDLFILQYTAGYVEQLMLDYVEGVDDYILDY